jgi:glycosyltransferase involved in cell wall biosynthesis
MSGVPIAFYAPLKSPGHPDPSGDRTMARLLLSALARAGFAPLLASELRTREAAGDETRQRELGRRSRQEADRLAASFAALPPGERPRLWFTYHSYYKAPDHLGPLMADRLDVPYAVAEASSAPKRAGGPWNYGHEAAEAAIAKAALLFVMTRHDREALERALRPGKRLVFLPPFLDPEPWNSEPARPPPNGHAAVRLLTVAMMREGDKLASYRLLAASLALLGTADWVLDLAGDGPARPEVERLFASFADRVVFHGRCSGAELAELYARADIVVWPAVNEAYGMALLEAQASGCPVVAGGYGGVADAMVPGTTGLMPRAGDAVQFAAALRALIGDPERRVRMGSAARRFITTERHLGAAATILGEALRPLLSQAAAA